MAKNLVIVESPKKINSFKKALGQDFEVMASRGHCVDLPEKSLAINIKKDFEPTFEIRSDHASIVSELKKAAKSVENIYLMTDEDREGEAIAWHLANQIEGTKAKILRATTNEITQKGITKAVSNPGNININKIDAYLARRLLDRLCGYKTSYLTQQATGGRSAGRVQSAILRIIVDREKEIQNFIPEEYWVLTAYLLSSKGEPYTGILSEKINVPNEAKATEIYNAVVKGDPVVTSVESKEVSANPWPPFTTATMQAAANTILNFGAPKTMQVAQALYEKGLCLHPDELVVTSNGRILSIAKAVEGSAIVGFGSADPQSLDLSTGEVDVLQHQKLTYSGDLIQICTFDGQEISATPDHKFLVFGNGEIQWRDAGHISDECQILCAKRVKVNRNFEYPHMYYLILHGLLGDHENIRVNLRDSTYTKDILCGIKKGPVYYKYLRQNKVPFQCVKEYFCWSSIEEEKFVRDNITSFLWASPGSKPEIFAVSDFFYFLGLCLGDGHITSSKIVFPKCIANEYVWKNILGSIGHEDRIGTGSCISVSGQILRRLCISFGGKEGNKAADIFLHEDVSGSDAHSQYFLAGLFDSDGCFNYKHGLQVLYTTISQRMAKEINVLLRSHGFLSGIRRRKSDPKNCSIKLTRQSGWKFMKKIIPFLRIKKKICEQIIRSIDEPPKDKVVNFPVIKMVEMARVDEGKTREQISLDIFGDSSSYCNYLRVLPGRQRPSNIPPEVLSKIADYFDSRLLKSIANGDAYFARIKSVNRVSYTGYVYDVSTSSENFIASSFYSHNCTYMRTDSTFMSDEAIQGTRAYITANCSAEYLPKTPNMYKAKKGAQEAHECCRPTDFHSYPHLSGDEAKLYELIWRRAIASQMTPGRDLRKKVITKIAGYDFISNGNVRLFDGYRKIWTYGTGKDVTLPDLAEGEKTMLKSLEKEQKFTQPSARYTDASLVKKCDTEQISRPATFHTFVETLKKRGYVKQKKKSFEATELGIAVIDFLVAANVCFVDIKFTADMEDLLDQIQEAKTTRSKVLADFWDRLKQDIEKGKEVKKSKQITKYKCPKCKGALLHKYSKFGAFYACENYKPKKDGKIQEGACMFTANVGEDGEPIEKVTKPKEYADFKCKKCGGKMVKRTSKYGTEFYGCENFSKTGCKCTADLDGNFTELSKKKWKKKKD